MSQSSKNLPSLSRKVSYVVSFAVALILTSNAWAVDFEWVGLGGVDNSWTNANNWDEIVFPDALDNIILTAASAAGPVTIDVAGSQTINRIEHQGVSGDYTFGETIGADTITIFQTAGNALLNQTTGGDLIINANVLLNQGNALLRFDSTNASDTSGKIIVNGDVAPAAGAIGTQTLVLTSTNKTDEPQIVVNGVISDGVGGAVLDISAGVEETASVTTISDHAGQIQLTGLNDFTGRVRVTGGTLVFDSIENVGSPDANALGKPLLADSVVSIGDASVTVGGIKYIGTSTDSNTSDRTINIAGSNSAATIDASGTVALVLNGGITTPSSSTVRMLTLTGDNTGENTIGTLGIVQTGTGDINLVKNGTGRWVLAATNTYEGTTNVNDGDLVVGSTGSINGSLRLEIGASGTFTLDGGSVTTTDINNFSGGTFDFRSGGVDVTAGTTAGGSGSLDIGTAGVGSLTLSGGSHLFGTVAVNGSDDSLTLSTGTLNAATVDNSNGGTFTFSGGTLNLNTAATGLTTGAGAISGRLIGAGDVTKVGSGALVLDLNTHTNSGDTNINEGSLQVTAAGRLSDGTTVNVASGTTLELLTTSADAIFGLNGAGDVLLGDANLILGNIDVPGSAGGVGTFSGTISDDPGPGIGDFEKKGTGTFTLAGQATHTGLTDVENGEMIVTGSIIGSRVTVTNGPLTGGGTLTIDGGTVDTPLRLAADMDTATLNLINGGSLTALQLDVVAGSNYLSTFNWTTGSIHLTSVVGVDVGVAPSSDQPFQNDLDLIAGKSLEIDNTTTVGAAGTLSISGGTLTTGNFDNTSGGTFSFDSGALEFTQDQTFDATFAERADVNTPIQAGRTLKVTTQATVNTPLVVAGGSVQFGSVVNPENLILDSGSFSVTASDLNVTAATSIDTSTGMTVSVTSGALNVAAGGSYNAIGSTLDVNSVSTNDGEINAINADLTFTGGLTNNAELNLINTNITGSVTSTASSSSTLLGTNSVSGDYTMADDDALFIDLAGLLPSEFDSLTLGGVAKLAGALNVSVDPSFALLDGQSFEIIDIAGTDIAGTQSGMFTGLADGAWVGNFGGVDLFIAYNGGDGNDVTLFTTAPDLPGDGNGDGWVDGLDYLLWAGGFGTHPGPDGDISDGDYNDDGWVDGLDYLLWAGNFGTHNSSAVPEPSTMMLALFAAFAFLSSPRRRC